MTEAAFDLCACINMAIDFVHDKHTYHPMENCESH